MRFKYNPYTKEFHPHPIPISFKLTPEGGYAVRLTNKTGAASVKGTIVTSSTAADKAFNTNGANNPQPIGIVYDNGVPDGGECYVVVFGIAQVLLKDSTNATRGYWVEQSDVAGRADASATAPPGGGIPELDQHMQEIGHCLETKSGGTDVLAKCLVHFN